MTINDFIFTDIPNVEIKNGEGLFVIDMNNVIFFFALINDNKCILYCGNSTESESIWANMELDQDSFDFTNLILKWLPINYIHHPNPDIGLVPIQQFIQKVSLCSIKANDVIMV